MRFIIQYVVRFIIQYVVRFIIQYVVPFWFCITSDEEERASCFNLTVFLMSYDSYCSVALPHGAVGCSAVCDLGISLPYTLASLYSLNCDKRYVYATLYFYE